MCTPASSRRGTAVADRLQGLQPRNRSLKLQVGQIGEAVKSIVPQEMWGAIIEKLEELEQHPEALDVGTGLLR